MFKRNLWKIALSVIITGWAVSELLPLRDIPFPQYVRDHATARVSEFNALLSQAEALKASGAAPSTFVALKQIGKENKIDLSQFFPDLRLEDSLKNVGKRNQIVLDELLRRSKRKLKLGLDLQGGIGVTLEAALGPKAAQNLDADTARRQKLSKAIEIISARINSMGVVEPLVRAVGENRIEVQMPGVNTKDDPEVLDAIKKPARLDFRMIYPAATPQSAAPGDIPPGYEIMTLSHEGRNGEQTAEELFVKRIPEMTGEMISNSSVVHDLYGRPQITMHFTGEGKKRFAEVTRDIAEAGHKAGTLGRLGIVLDGTLYSAPTVKEEIDSDSAVIEGPSITDREALETANVLNNPLDLPLVVREQYEVSPSLAEDAISSGVRASVIALAAVAAFMVTFYVTGGAVAVVVGLAVNLFIIAGVMSNLQATLTLPGLAGIVLTIGMAVDANILINERIREEQKRGRPPLAALEHGFQRAYATIFDSNAATFLSHVMLFVFGSGPVKGFAVTITIGIATSMFTAWMLTRLLVSQWYISVRPRLLPV